MEESRAVALRFLASQLVFVAALIHLGVGAMEWLRRLQYGIVVPIQLQYPLFVLSGVAVVAGLAVAWQSPRRRPWYLAGFVAMLGYVLAYFAYHLAGHRRAILWGRRLAPPEPVTLQFFVDHYFATPMATITLTVELLAAILLGVLYVADQD
jgi:hypothetical protein